MEELDRIREKKLKEMKKHLSNGGKNMNKNWPNEPIKINDENIEEVVKKYDTAVIDCWAEWCAPCRMLTPVINELAKEMQGEVVFGKLNVDQNKNTASKYSVMSIPTMLVFKNGELVDRLVGAQPKENLKQRLKKYQ